VRIVFFLVEKISNGNFFLHLLKIFVRQLGRQDFWVRIQTFLKIINGPYKQRSGQHTLAREKNSACNSCEDISCTEAKSMATIFWLPVTWELLARTFGHHVVRAVLRIRIPDPVPFWPLDLGSGMGLKSGSGMNNPESGSYFRELRNNFWG
jgi:hypothetical protein